MIHRAILGSVERFIAILCENYAGKWSAVYSSYSSLSCKTQDFMFVFVKAVLVVASAVSDHSGCEELRRVREEGSR